MEQTTGAQTTATEPQGTAATTNQQNTDNKDTISRSELDSHIGKAVDTALKNNNEKWQKKYEEGLAAAKSEAEAYAKMTAEEKQKAAQEKERKAFEAEKAAFEKEKLLVEIQKDLQEKQMPLAFAEAVVFVGDAEKAKAVVENLKQVWDEQISEHIKAKARQNPPAEGGRFNAEESDKASIGEMARKARIIR